MSSIKKGFGVSTGFVAEGIADRKLEPGIYLGGSISHVGLGTKQDFNTKQDIDVIEVIVKDAITGKEHLDQTAFAEGETAKGYDKTQMMFERLMHIASSILTEEELAAFIGKAGELTTEEGTPDFIALAKGYSAILTPKLKESKVDFKIVGSVYNGKGNTKLPGFNSIVPTPFITKSGSTTTLKFSGNEIKDNTAYNQVISGASLDTTATPPVLSSKPEAGSLFA